MKTIVVGLGNPILGDDGVGWRVAEEVKRQIDPHAPVDVECVSLGGISLMEYLIGYERVILVDAFLSDEEVGSIKVMRLDEIPDYSALHTANAHDTSLQTAMELGRYIGAKVPKEVIVVGISATQVHDFSEDLSPPVAASVRKAAQVVVELAMQTITIH